MLSSSYQADRTSQEKLNMQPSAAQKRRTNCCNYKSLFIPYLIFIGLDVGTILSLFIVFDGFHRNPLDNITNFRRSVVDLVLITIARLAVVPALGYLASRIGTVPEQAKPPDSSDVENNLNSLKQPLLSGATELKQMADGRSLSTAPLFFCFHLPKNSI